jgi:hypothetical protein
MAFTHTSVFILFQNYVNKYPCAVMFAMLRYLTIFWNIVSFVEISYSPSSWLQGDNVKNQREHIIHLLANEQSRVGKLSGNEPVFFLFDIILLRVIILDMVSAIFLE